MQLGASNSHPGVLQSCTALTELMLLNVDLLDLTGLRMARRRPAAAAGGGTAATMPQLSCFKLCWLDNPAPKPAQKKLWAAFEARLLPHLAGLTQLVLISPAQLLLKQTTSLASRLESLQIGEAG